jgi:hypothetical protein
MADHIADTLDRAADLIEPEGAWTQGWFARDERGRGVLEDAAEAVCFCIFGALMRVSQDDADDALDILRSVIPEGISYWNDAPGRKQSEVVAKLREAAAKAREQVPS